MGVRAGMTVLYLISILKLAPLLLLIVIGFPAIEWARVVDSGLIAPTQLGQSMLVLMYAFIGFEFSLIAAGETRNAKATVPRALIGTVIAIALCYALIQLVAVSVGPDLGNWTCNGCIIASLQSSVVGMGRLIASGRASTR